mmetsp:Transcript_53871/g.144218  ORF Transcript_53871/g.144218 Transcript_53871/m.144218 type:complete len:149 (-) Transcript_53871:1266-1712(-)
MWKQPRHGATLELVRGGPSTIMAALRLQGQPQRTGVEVGCLAPWAQLVHRILRHGAPQCVDSQRGSAYQRDSRSGEPSAQVQARIHAGHWVLDQDSRSRVCPVSVQDTTDCGARGDVVHQSSDLDSSISGAPSVPAPLWTARCWASGQ